MKSTAIIPDTLLETVELPQPMMESYGRYSVCFQAATTWNNLRNILPIDMLSENYSIVRKGLTNYFFWSIITAGNTSSIIQGVSEKKYSETLIILKL